MIHRFLIAASAAALLVAAAPPSPAPASPADPATLFGAREGVRQISLSPSGERVAFIAPGPGQSNALFIADAAGGKAPTRVFTADGKPERLTGCDWVSEKRLVCRIYMLLDNIQADQIWPGSRIIALDADGGNPRMVSMRGTPDDLGIALTGGRIVDWLPGEDGALLMSRYYMPQSKLNTRFVETRQGLGVDRVDTTNLQTRTVEQPKMHGTRYISDGHGNVRIMGVEEVVGATGVDSGHASWFYRLKGGHDWKPLSTWDETHDEGFLPIAVDPVTDRVFGQRKIDGRLALAAISLDGSMREETVFAHPQVDVDGAYEIGRDQRVVGATFVTDKRQTVYFDKDLAALAQMLSKALPGLPLVQFVDASADGSKLLLWAGSDTDPGRFYIFDKATKQMRELMLSRPELEGAALATVKPVTYKAADGTAIPAYLTLPPGSTGRGLPAIVMPHGGPESRDEWGFDWLAQYFAHRGYAVIQPNFRGSSGYGDAWFQKNGFQSWRTSIGDVNDAGRWLVAQGIADPQKLAIFGWSYGGYAALQANVLDPDLFKAAVAVAPVTDLAMLVQEERYRSSVKLVRDYVGSGPQAREGSPAQNADRIKAPVLLFHGDHDVTVGFRESQLMADRLKDAGRQVEFVKYEKLDHQLDDSAARADMLRRTDAFLRAALKLN